MMVLNEGENTLCLLTYDELSLPEAPAHIGQF
jgi:hypothetical protein